MSRGYLINPESDEEAELEAEMASDGVLSEMGRAPRATASGSGSGSGTRAGAHDEGGSEPDLFGSAHSGDGDASGSLTSDDVASALDAPESPGPRLHHTKPTITTTTTTKTSKPPLAPLMDTDRSATTSPDLPTPPISPMAPPAKLAPEAEEHKSPSKGKGVAITQPKAHNQTKSPSVKSASLPKRKSAVRFDVPSSPSSSSATLNGAKTASNNGGVATDLAQTNSAVAPASARTPDTNNPNPEYSTPAAAIEDTPERVSSLAPPPLSDSSAEEEAKLGRIMAKLSHLEIRVADVEGLNGELQLENAVLKKKNKHLKHTLAVVRGSNRVTSEALTNAVAMIGQLERDRVKLVDDAGSAPV